MFKTAVSSISAMAIIAILLPLHFLFTVTIADFGVLGFVLNSVNSHRTKSGLRYDQALNGTGSILFFGTLVVLKSEAISRTKVPEVGNTDIFELKRVVCTQKLGSVFAALTHLHVLCSVLIFSSYILTQNF